MTLQGRASIVPYSGDGASVWFAMYTCDECGFASLGQIEVGDIEHLLIMYANRPDARYDDGDRSFANIRAAVGWYMSLPNADVNWYPVKGMGKEYENVPADIASAASEAYSCFFINANRAAVLLARTTIEAIAKDKGVTEGLLFQKIDEMAKRDIITNQLRDEAHEIRHLGNDMAHGDLNVEINEEDAEDILGFLDSVIDYVYQQPIAIEKRKRLREARKQRSKS